MKKIIVLIALIIAFNSCSKDGDASLANTTGAGGSMARFTTLGNYLYTIDGEYMNVFEISNGSNPVFKNKVYLGFGVETIYPFNNYIFIGSTSVVYIYSVTNPEKPILLSQASSRQVFRRCDPVVVKDSTAYATLRTSGACGGGQSILAAYDIKDINNPYQRNFLNMDEPLGLGYNNNTLYVCDAISGLNVFDISNPHLPVLLKKINDGSYIDVVPYKNELICWIKDGLLIYDINNNSNPIKIAKIN
jgi:hypothetical protein